jgi:GGDEF domain-containing protein
MDLNLLLADSSEAHLKAVVEVGPEGRGPRCTVPSPNECPAVRRAQTLVASSSLEIDACPYLRRGDTDPRSAACVPLSVAGRTIGVLHVTSDEHAPPKDDEIGALESIAVAGFTCSFGVADTTDASGLEELLEAADTALFRAKQAGRNRVVLAHAEVA